MSIPDLRQKCNKLLEKAPRDALIVGVLVGASLASFGLGYLAGRDEGARGQGSGASLQGSSAPIAGGVVASMNGTKYYTPTCKGVERIEPDNRVWFASAALAEDEGYEPAENCF
jgi:hypothetical protein